MDRRLLLWEIWMLVRLHRLNRVWWDAHPAEQP
jgi:hypothetical protein